MKPLFLFALLTQLGSRWSDLQGTTQQHNLPSIFVSKWRWQFLSSLLSLQLALVLLSLGTTSVDCLHHSSSKCCACDAWCKCHMTVFFIVFCEFIIACFVVVLDVLVAGDLRYEYALSTWGFLFRGPPGSWLHSLCLHCSNWCSFDGDCCHVMSIVVILTTSSWRFCHVCWQGRLVAPRMIATALLIALEELLSQERFCPSQWWHWLHPLGWSLIMPITIDDGFVACCCLLQLCLVPMLALCSQLGFLMVW